MYPDTYRLLMTSLKTTSHKKQKLKKKFCDKNHSELEIDTEKKIRSQCFIDFKYMHLFIAIGAIIIQNLGHA